MANQKNIREVKAPSVVVNNRIAIREVSKRISILTWLVSINLVLILVGWVAVIALILFRMYL